MTHYKLATLIIALAVAGTASAFPPAMFSTLVSRSQATHPMGLRLQPSQLAPAYNYYPNDEQVGTTFTQDFSRLAFNVTAIAQTGPDGVGPAYLLNGLSDAGYWYQVGISYHWPHVTGGYYAGFSMNYEVFDQYGNSVFPTDGGGGVQNISVHNGDTVLLSLNFTSGQVVMTANDLNTNSVGSLQYSASFGSYFVGLTGSNSQSGVFTGLMTEQYHSQSFYGAGQPVFYSSRGLNMSSVWLWMDEFNVDTGQSIFQDSTPSPVTLDNTAPWQFRSANGVGEAASPSEFATGLAPVESLVINSASQPRTHPGNQTYLSLNMTNPSSVVAKVTSLKISTNLGSYNATSNIPYTIQGRNGNLTTTFTVPNSTATGNYTLTIVASWQFFDSQLEQWVARKDLTTQTVMHVTATPNTPPPNPPPSNTNPGGKPPPTSPTTPSNGTRPQTRTTGLLSGVRGVLLAAAVGYIAIVLLGIALFVREVERGKDAMGAGLPTCIACGGLLDSGMLYCPNCGQPTRSISHVDANPPPVGDASTQTSPAEQPTT